MSYTPPYNTIAEIQRRTGITGNSNIATASIQTKITIADGMVDGYISDVYSLPLSSTCSLVKEVSGEIAEALILREQYGPEVEDTDKDGQKKFDQAVDILKKIQSRELKLLTDSSPRAEFSKRTSTSIKGYPNSTSDVLTTSASTAPVIRMGDSY